MAKAIIAEPAITFNAVQLANYATEAMNARPSPKKLNDYMAFFNDKA